MEPIELIFPKLSMLERTAEPAVIATPHKVGELKDIMHIRVCCGEKVFPSQSYMTSCWQDGSAKWLLTRFLADLPANAGCIYSLCNGEPNSIKQPVKATWNPDSSVRLENSALTVLLGAPGSPIISFVSTDSVSFQDTEVSGPFIQVGTARYETLVGEKGWEIVENGQVFIAVRTRGKHLSATGEEILDFELTASVVAGRPELELEYRVIHCEEAPYLDIEAMCFDICPDTPAQRFSLAKSHYGTTIYESRDEPLHFLIDEAYISHEDIEHAPEVFAGTFFSNWRDNSRGICLYINQAFQNFPKALEADKSGIRAHLVPECHPVRLYQGSSKRHRVLLRFHNPDEDMDTLDVRGLQYEMPDRPFLKPEAYLNAGLYGEYILKKNNPFMEAQIKRMANDTRSSLGIMNFGDWWDGGEWQNNEYDAVHWFMVQYARTGERTMLDKVLVFGEHWMDVDICHFSRDPRRIGAHIQHSPEHAVGDVEVCHQWIEGLLDYYHIKGDKRALDAALGVGHNIIYILETHIYPRRYYGFPRELGWALRALAALYNETYDSQWEVPCDKIVERFFKWQAEFGAWLSPYTKHTHIRVPFMQSVAIRALTLYERIKPDERVRKMILNEINDILTNGVSHTGMFYYKELPGTQADSLIGHIFESIAIGYQYTCDKAYILRSRDAFEYFMRYEINNICSPRNFAEAFPGIVAYMKALEDTEIL